MHSILARAALSVFTGMMSSVATVAAGGTPDPPTTLSVCLTLSSVVAVAARREAAMLDEVGAIWRPMGVVVRPGGRSDHSCDRLIAVKSDLEAAPEHAAAETVLGWVPFVEGHARQLVYLRVSRARTMIYAVSLGKRPGGITDLLVAMLLGRSLAHELGHVLLNSRDHSAKGLMRSLYRAEDVLREPADAYTLDVQQRARLFANHAYHTRLLATLAEGTVLVRSCMVSDWCGSCQTPLLVP
jgi:hypothetical protein